MNTSRWAATMALLTTVFAFRVAGQAVQRFDPQAWLPPFATWQGSAVDYLALLAIQLSILTGMAWTSWRAWAGKLRASVPAARWLGAFGGVYLAGAVSRIAIGLAMPAHTETIRCNIAWSTISNACGREEALGSTKII